MRSVVALTALALLMTAVISCRDDAPSAPIISAASARPKVRAHAPLRSNGNAIVEDIASGMRVVFSARGAGETFFEVEPDALEDFVRFDARPALEALTYDVDVSSAAGLRLVGNTLELLDASGAPRLRMSPPYLIGADGGERPIDVSLEGCAFDATPIGPWNRPVTAPGAAQCALHLAWSGVPYPALVDPRWSATGMMTVARTNHRATLLQNGKVLLTGGGVSSAELFDPATGTFAATGSMSEIRTRHTATRLASGKVLIAGGDGASAGAELYDPSTGIFSVTGPLATGRALCAATLLGTGKLLVMGGETSDRVALATAELYDEAAGIFAGTGAMAAPRTEGVSTVLPSGKVLVAGGLDGAPTYNALSSAELYDPATGKFSATGSLVTPRYDHTFTLLGNGTVLVAGGFPDNAFGIPQALASCELYDPTTGAFTKTMNSLTEARHFHTATLLADGRVLIAGGGTYVSGSATTNFYDPLVGTFVNGPLLTLGERLEHQAVRLSTDEVLITGGMNELVGEPATYASAELLSAAIPGVTCVTADECDTGLFCVDGVCCNSACTGQCEACDVPGKLGTCSPAIGAPRDNRKPCEQAGAACGGACDGSGRLACAYPSSETDCGRSCTAGRETVSTCDGKSHCLTSPSHVCNDNYVCAVDGQCATHCMASADCVLGFGCAPDGRCIANAVCVDDHTSQGANGNPEACSPFKCDGADGGNGGCLTKCSSVDDCVAPTVCDPTGKCVESDAPPTDSGCSGSGHPIAKPWWLGALGLLLVRFARRKLRMPRIRSAM